MTKYYCKCLNICIEINECIAEPFENHIILTDAEKKNDFFQQLPLFVVRICEVLLQQPALVKSKKVGSWIIYKCLNCSAYSYATENSDNPAIMLVNKLLTQVNEEHLRSLNESADYSPVFRIMSNSSSSEHSYFDNNSILEESLYNRVLQLKKIFLENIDQKSKQVEENIRIFTEQQQNVLKKYAKRANDDFQTLKNTLIKTNENEINENTIFETILNYEPTAADRISTTDTVITNVEKKVTNRDEKQENEKLGTDDTNEILIDIPPSLDSEGLFLLDGMEDNVLDDDDDDHSEDDQSDTDDSGSRDEGIHIPRRKSIVVAKSLPIKVPTDFDPSLHLFNGRFDENKIKPNYRQKRNERPVDIAASIKALANSVHGDTIFGDLPPPRIGSRI